MIECKFCGNNTYINDAVYCSTCGERISDIQPDEKISISNKQSKASSVLSLSKPKNNNIGTSSGRKPKSKKIAIALDLCVLIGLGGLHRLYVGKTISGILYLFTVGGCLIGAIVDLIAICNDNFTDKDGKILR